MVLVAATLLALGRLATSDFVVWDDSINLYRNPHLNPPTLQGVGHYWVHSAHGLYIPLTYTLWAGLAMLARVEPDVYGSALNPWIYHSFNVALHVLSALVAFRILERLVRSAWAACAGALLFALHPVQVEAVGWAAGMKDVLSGLLALVAIWQYILYAEGTDPPRPAASASQEAEASAGSSRRARWHYALATAAFVLSMLAKPSGMVAPAIALIVDFWLLRRPPGLIVRALGPWLVLSVACAVIARIAQETGGVQPAPLWARPFVAGDALAFYLLKLAWPMTLTMDYGRRPLVTMEKWWFYLSWLLPVALGAWLWLNRRRWPELFAAGVILLAAVSPVLGLFTFQFQYISSVADHYLYVAMLGPALAASWLVERAAQRLDVRIVAMAAALVLGALGVRSFIQAGVWQNNFTLFSHAIRINPRSFVSLNNLGHVCNMEGDLELAELYFRRSLEAKPDYWLARKNLAAVLEVQGRFQEAVAHRSEALRILSSENPSLRNDLAQIAAVLAVDLAILGRPEEARAHFELALEYRPGFAAALAGLEDLKRREPPPSTSPSEGP